MAWPVTRGLLRSQKKETPVNKLSLMTICWLCGTTVVFLLIVNPLFFNRVEWRMYSPVPNEGKILLKARFGLLSVSLFPKWVEIVGYMASSAVKTIWAERETQCPVRTAAHIQPSSGGRNRGSKGGEWMDIVSVRRERMVWIHRWMLTQHLRQW